MPNRLSTTFQSHATPLQIQASTLQSSLSNTRLISRANLNNLAERLNTIQFKMKELTDEIEELQYDLDREDIKMKPDPTTENRIKEFERTYDMLQPVLGLALLSYLNSTA